jgi:hypothetical protein
MMIYKFSEEANLQTITTPQEQTTKADRNSWRFSTHLALSGDNNRLPFIFMISVL